MSKKKYVLWSGYVESETDGEEHLVTCQQLARLYGVHPAKCYMVPLNAPRKRAQARYLKRRQDLVHLHPREDGNYTLPE